jgi:BirA family biotin operon repressor/biotin-[acetyl-CoA-carboxylase] ligase
MKNYPFRISRIQETASTNLLMQTMLASGKLKSGDVIRAINQKEGQGQSGNKWESEAGKNLTFSVFIQHQNLAAENLFMLNKAIALALRSYLKAQHIAEVKIKWPNDIYVGDKKIAGMLTFNSFLGNKLNTSIIGLGLNMNQIHFRTNAPKPVSLRQLTGLEYSLDSELQKLLEFIGKRLVQLETVDFNALNADYLKSLYRIHTTALYKDKQGRFYGKIRDVDSYGRLCVEKEDKTKAYYDLKEITFL